MELFPAIDLKDGCVVRLFQGDYDQKTVYSHDPVEIAEGFAQKGAGNLHVVDLDGARDGTPANVPAIRELAGRKGVFMQVGGGIRTEERVDRYLSLGVNRVILGTAAIENFAFVEEMVKRYGGQIAVGVDARDGKVAVHGWEKVSGVDSMEFCRRLRDTGVQTVIYTDISRDGGLAGTNLEAYRALGGVEGLDVVASGGVSFEEEIAALKDIGTYGVIVGKALYAGKLDLVRLLELCKG